MPKETIPGPRRYVGRIDGSYSIIPSKPLIVENETQLLMDGCVIEDMWNIRRTVHAPEKHSENPLIRSGKYSSGPVSKDNVYPDGLLPWEGCILAGNGCVMYDDESGKFRNWQDLWDMNNRKGAKSYLIVYHESEDGIHWKAPDLGIYDFKGSRHNNITWAGGDEGDYLASSCSVIKVPRHKQRLGRYAMLYGRSEIRTSGQVSAVQGEGHTMEQRIAWSDDGIHWKDQPENPAFHARSDTINNMVYNRDRGVFMQYRRPSVNAHEIRKIAYSESDDLIHWTQPEVCLENDELDPPMLYGMAVDEYHGVCFGFLQMFYFQDYDHKLEKSAQIDIQLAWSRDGKTWERHPERPVFLETGHPPAYDWGMIFVEQGIIERDDRIFIYYRGDEQLHVAMPGQYGNFCMAELRKDGFVSRDAGTEDGYMFTKPILCPGGKLKINARTGAKGFVKMAVRRGDGEADGEWLPGWDFPDCRPFSGDSVSGDLGFHGKDNMDSWKGRSIRLHFWMKDAQMFSFRFE